MNATAWFDVTYSTFSEDNNKTCHSPSREVAMKV